MAQRISSPDGRAWVVRRQWVPRLGTETLWGRLRRRIRQTWERVGDAPDPGCLDVFGEGLVAGLVIIAVVLVLLFVALPLLVALVDLVFVLLLALLGVAARVLLRRPWTVEACADDGEMRTWRVVGWRASGAKVDEVAQHLEAGLDPPDDSV